MTPRGTHVCNRCGKTWPAVYAEPETAPCYGCRHAKVAPKERKP